MGGCFRPLKIDANPGMVRYVPSAFFIGHPPPLLLPLLLAGDEELLALFDVLSVVSFFDATDSVCKTADEEDADAAAAALISGCCFD
jgi:hypothetical protein